jgi:rRNA processing protein Krr1/Pno1
MSTYYQQNKASLPPSIRKNREQIVELIMEGFSPEEAFAIAPQSVV